MPPLPPPPTPSAPRARGWPRPATADAPSTERIAAATADLERGKLDAARERLRKVIDTGTPSSVFSAATLLASTYPDPSAQLVVWDKALQRLSDPSPDRAHAEKERLRVLVRLGRHPPQPTTAE